MLRLHNAVACRLMHLLLHAYPRPTESWMLPAPCADKHEYSMVGGHWDPQDGGHPASDPVALTRTAARHFKAATGLDLSGCTQVGVPGLCKPRIDNAVVMHRRAYHRVGVCQSASADNSAFAAQSSFLVRHH